MENVSCSDGQSVAMMGAAVISRNWPPGRGEQADAGTED